MKIRTKFLALLVMLSLFTSVIPVHAVETVDATSEIPYASWSSTFDSTYNGNVTAYDAEGAKAAGVPDGYSGYVLRVQPGSNGAYAGCELDFSSQNIPVDNIKSLTFTLYLPAGHTEMRLLGEATGGSWIMRAAPDTLGAWCDITLDADGTNFQSGRSFSAFANASGNLGKMCLIARLGSGTDKSFYLDSVRIQYKAGASNDKTPPVITYNGPTEITANEGDVFALNGLSAYDEYDKANAQISYEWSAGALDGASCLKAGTHTCTVKAMDRSGNVSTLEITVTVAVDNSLIRIEDIPHIPHDTAIADAVYEGALTELSESEAEAKGLPGGYKGSVYEISYSAGKSYVGVCLDFSEYGIPINLVDSITFNVLVPTSYSELRMRNGNTTDWIMRCSTAPTGAWNSVVLNSDGLNFFGSAKMQTLANSNGELGSLCLIGRVSGTYEPYYIDSIVIRLKTDDGAAPKINYTGKTDILTSSGKPFAPAISAYDELEQRNIALVYDWSAGALDEGGNMLEGEHTCRVSATDYYGNTSYLDLNVTVGPPDVEAPEIHFFASEIFVPVGTFYRMTPYATDNYDDVEVVEIWSAGALDPAGRLNEGVHTLTLTATDLSGNKTEKVVTVYVVSTDSTVGTLIDQGK